VTRRLGVNPITCNGHGACAELLPELISLDDWGYPIVDDADVPDALLAHAKRAVAACPTLALSLQASSAMRMRSSKRGGDG
jgi:ferredoxin